MKIQLIDKTKKKKIIEELSYFGVEKIPYLLMMTGNERVRAYSGNLSNEEIMKIYSKLRVEALGLYFGKLLIDRHGKKEARLSLDALHILKNEIRKNIVKLNEEQEENWFRGKDIELTEEQQDKDLKENEFVAILSFDGKDFIGTGKLSLDKKHVSCFLPKERRRKD